MGDPFGIQEEFPFPVRQDPDPPGSPQFFAVLFADGGQEIIAVGKLAAVKNDPVGPGGRGKFFTEKEFVARIAIIAITTRSSISVNAD